MIGMNRTPTAGEVAGVQSFIDFVVALQRDPAVFDAVLGPIREAIAKTEAAAADVAAQTAKMHDAKVALDAATANAAEANESVARERVAAGAKAEQIKVAHAELDEKRAQVSKYEADLKAEHERVRALAKRTDEAQNLRARELDAKAQSLGVMAAHLQNETQAEVTARAAYEKKLADLKAAVGA